MMDLTMLCKMNDNSDADSCFRCYTNHSLVAFKQRKSDSTTLGIDNIKNRGLIIVDTKFDSRYDFELEDPCNSKQIIGFNKTKVEKKKKN
jgi:hypothetical protein